MKRKREEGRGGKVMLALVLCLAMGVAGCGKVGQSGESGVNNLATGQSVTGQVADGQTEEPDSEGAEEGPDGEAPMGGENPKEITLAPGENDVRLPIQIRGQKRTLEAKLTLPETGGGEEKPKLVIMVQGSGQSDYNETIGAAGNAPFRDFAEGLAERGIASLRFNKRYYEHRDLAAQDVTIQEEVLDDVGSAIRFAGELDCCSEIYVMGHSLGAMVAPVIARDHPEVAGMICLAGSPRTLQEIVYDQNEAALEQERQLSGEQKKQQLAMLKNAVKQINGLTQESEGNYLGVDARYWYSLNQLRQAEVARELDIPILMQQGSADFQVYADVDFEQWKKLLKGKKNVTFQLYPGLNHLFMKTQGKKDASEYDVAAKVSEDVIDHMAEFIKQH